MVVCIREMEPSQRPRERLMAHGAVVLSDAELIAVLLRTGRRGRGAIGEAHDLLREAEGLAGLVRQEIGEIVKRPGFGPAKAATLAAAIELGRRLARAEVDRHDRLDRPEIVGRWLVRQLRGRRTELFGLVSLDGRHRLLRQHELSRGTRRSAPVDAGELFRHALIDGAAGAIVFHNHPSGVLDPSRDDLELTRRLAAGGALVGVDLLDHLIIAETRWLSLRTVHPELF